MRSRYGGCVAGLRDRLADTWTVISIRSPAALAAPACSFGESRPTRGLSWGHRSGVLLELALNVAGTLPGQKR